ncbi:hypothetical protein BJX68DRAFT_274316 [Aspergillus pseudodeflectus]|uniref:BTB domain-containing protein n=1 Tax=Aspergillus pseudodeflectus TaxID=176178 RepID=A0ABR4JA31_9EURO
MEKPTHIIDPDGEAIIVLRTTDPYLAQVTKADDDADPPPAPSPPEPEGNGIFERAVSPVRATKSVSRKSKKGKKKNNHRTNRSAPSHDHPAEPEPAPEPEPVPDSAWGFHLEMPPEPQRESEPALGPPPEPATEGSFDELEPAVGHEPEWVEQAPPAEPAEACWPDDEPTTPTTPAPEDPVPEDPDEPALEPEDAPAPEPTPEPMGQVLRIQVSAKHLALASPVFKQELRDSLKNEIHARGWGTLPFFILLQIIHCQNSKLPRALSLDTLADVARLADYYQCKDTIGILTEIWIKALPEPDTTKLSRDLMLWLWVAFFFHLGDAFSKISSAVLSLGDGPIDSLDLPFPSELLDNMDYHRQHAIEQALRLVDKTQASLLRTDGKCGFECSSIMYGSLTKELHRTGLSSVPMRVAPFPGLSYTQLVQKISSIRSPTWFTRSRDIWGRDYVLTPHKCDGSSFEQVFGQLGGSVPGLELRSCLVEY